MRRKLRQRKGRAKLKQEHSVRRPCLSLTPWKLWICFLEDKKLAFVISPSVLSLSSSHYMAAARSRVEHNCWRQPPWPELCTPYSWHDVQLVHTRAVELVIRYLNPFVQSQVGRVISPRPLSAP